MMVFNRMIALIAVQVFTLPSLCRAFAFSRAPATLSVRVGPIRTSNGIKSQDTRYSMRKMPETAIKMVPADNNMGAPKGRKVRAIVEKFVLSIRERDLGGKVQTTIEKLSSMIRKRDFSDKKDKVKNILNSTSRKLASTATSLSEKLSESKLRTVPQKLVDSGKVVLKSLNFLKKKRRMIPRPSEEKARKMAEKYASIDCVEERAFAVLKDLNMIDSTIDFSI